MDVVKFIEKRNRIYVANNTNCKFCSARKVVDDES